MTIHPAQIKVHDVVDFFYMGGSNPGSYRRLHVQNFSIRNNNGYIEGIDIDQHTYKRFSLSKIVNLGLSYSHVEILTRKEILQTLYQHMEELTDSNLVYMFNNMKRQQNSCPADDVSSAILDYDSKLDIFIVDKD